MKGDFGLFLVRKMGAVWKGGFTNLKEAKRTAQAIANAEGKECFLYNFERFREIAKFLPIPPGPQAART